MADGRARLGVVALVAGLAGAGCAREAAPRIAWAVCDGVAADVDAVVTGRLRLHAELSPGTDEAVREAVALQLRYAFATLHNDEGQRVVWTPDGPPRDVEVVARRTAAYGRDVALDWPEDPELRPTSAYVRAALRRGRVAAEDPAIEVEWRARVRVARCDPDGQAPAELRLAAPEDPHLAYWLVAASRRTPHVYGDRRVVGFPCAAPEIADYAHPEYLWYYWRPRGCAALRAEELGEVTLSVVRAAAPAGDLAGWRDEFAAGLAARPLRIAVVFGYLDHQAARPDDAAVRAALVGDGAAELEWGSEQFVGFVRATETLLDGRTLATPVGAEGPVAEISGSLRRSGRRVEIAAHLTEADVLAPARYAPRHVPLLLAGLREADVIVYAGHSGLGINFSRAQLERGAAGAVDAALAGSPTRMIAFIGCYTYAYFGDDLAGALPPGVLFAYTGNSVAEVGVSALHVLRTLDCLLAGDGHAGACEVPPPGEDFVIYAPAR